MSIAINWEILDVDFAQIGQGERIVGVTTWNVPAKNPSDPPVTALIVATGRQVFAIQPVAPQRIPDPSIVPEAKP